MSYPTPDPFRATDAVFLPNPKQDFLLLLRGKIASTRGATLMLMAWVLSSWTLINGSLTVVAQEANARRTVDGPRCNLPWVEEWLDSNIPSLVADYWWLHENPEVSFEEVETAAYVAKAWEAAGLEVTKNVGGHGVVGVLANGSGPTIMLRTDLDALPVTEATGLPRASTKKIVTASGVSTGVMHACGHDVHMTNLIGMARLFSAHRDQWKGTLVLIGQPAEERGGGAEAMLKDGLFTRFPRPDAVVALHCEASSVEQVAFRAGYMMANVDSVDIRVHGRGGHGAAPHTAIDPIVQASELVLSLQTSVSRELKPTEPAVITVGSIHAGTKHNIIGDYCDLQLTVRSYSPEVREQLIAAIRRKAKGIAMAYGAEEPTVTLSDGTPSLFNHEALTLQLKNRVSASIGPNYVQEAEQVMGGEDFSQYGIAGVPVCMYRLGVIDAGRLAAMKKRGQTMSLHSPEFYPDIDRALPMAVRSMAVCAVELFASPPPKK
ncbi:putative hydrolase YxeP [Pirellula sp. SH-Sr6A]|uniref:M20 metallopeptidase family protein n=1 Tax=Pirellula sp. SH-Sr6A TaxID=1632865 RepID=UPI00078DC7D7|nr:amidohydrolase [Pirellula sp. SH-Sr6A]AMV35484.1 putative hydrolase YxeP [Pirellula sp. SH-Sr6A]